MEIPKKIQRLLIRRERLAMDLISAVNDIDKWLEENGADMTDPMLVDSTISGCMIYCEPWNARSNVENYIRTKL